MRAVTFLRRVFLRIATLFLIDIALTPSRSADVASVGAVAGPTIAVVTSTIVGVAIILVIFTI